MTAGEFSAVVLATVQAIPAGSVMAYGMVAQMAGFPGRARHVGRVLAGLPADSSIPWHRVVRADGHLAFAETDRNFRRQKRALAAEGVRFHGRRVPARYFTAGVPV